MYSMWRGSMYKNRIRGVVERGERAMDREAPMAKALMASVTDAARVTPHAPAARGAAMSMSP
jgi:hypothetical protein